GQGQGQGQASEGKGGYGFSFFVSAAGKQASWASAAGSEYCRPAFLKKSSVERGSRWHVRACIVHKKQPFFGRNVLATPQRAGICPATPQTSCVSVDLLV